MRLGERSEHGVLRFTGWIIAAVLLCLAHPLAEADAQNPNREQFVDWGLEVYGKTVDTLGLAGSPRFAERAHLGGGHSGGSRGQAFVWPLSTQFRVQNSLARLDPTQFVPSLRQFSDQLHSDYWRSGAGGYRSGVSGSADLFYDDNAHLVVALAEAYQITRDPIYLSRAKQTYQFVISGEDMVGGGGIYFREGDFGFKDSVSTLQGARSALMLFQATGDATYLDDADRLYTWAENTTQQPDGLFMEKLFLTGPQAGQVGNFTLINSAGMGISTNIEFYDSTGDPDYLAEAQRLANRSLTRYFQSSTGRINDEGFWAFELVDALVDLHARDEDPRWSDAVEQGLVWLHENKQDPNGHYGRFWGREGPQNNILSSWELNDQAPVARAYLHVATVPDPLALSSDLTDDRSVDFADLTILLANWNQDAGVAGGNLVDPANTKVDFADLTTLLADWTGSAAGSPQAALGSEAVPEPSSLVLALLATLGLSFYGRRRRRAF